MFYFLDTLSVGYSWWLRIFLNQKIIHEGKQGLKKFISQIGGLSDGTMIDAGEKIMAFMTIIRDNTYRDTAAIWQHGYRQICASVHEVTENIEKVCGGECCHISPEITVNFVKWIFKEVVPPEIIAGFSQVDSRSESTYGNKKKGNKALYMGDYGGPWMKGLQLYFKVVISSRARG